MSTGVGRGYGLGVESLTRSLDALYEHYQVYSGSVKKEDRRLVKKVDGEGGHYLDFCKPTQKQAFRATFGQGSASCATIASFCAEHRIVNGALVGALEKGKNPFEKISKKCLSILREELRAEYQELSDAADRMARSIRLDKKEESFLQYALRYLAPQAARVEEAMLIGATEHELRECVIFLLKCATQPDYLHIAAAFFCQLSEEERGRVIGAFFIQGQYHALFDIFITAKTGLPVTWVLNRANSDESGYQNVVANVITHIAVSSGGGISVNVMFIERFIESGYTHLAERLLRRIAWNIHGVMSKAIAEYAFGVLALGCLIEPYLLDGAFLLCFSKAELERFIDEATLKGGHDGMVARICHARGDIEPFCHACATAETADDCKNILRRLKKRTPDERFKLLVGVEGEETLVLLSRRANNRCVPDLANLIQSHLLTQEKESFRNAEHRLKRMSFEERFRSLLKEDERGLVMSARRAAELGRQWLADTILLHLFIMRDAERVLAEIISNSPEDKADYLRSTFTLVHVEELIRAELHTVGKFLFLSYPDGTRRVEYMPKELARGEVAKFNNIIDKLFFGLSSLSMIRHALRAKTTRIILLPDHMKKIIQNIMQVHVKAHLAPK